MSGANAREPAALDGRYPADGPDGRERPGDIALQSVITCPQCGHRQRETMPTDACQFFYDCAGCGAVLRPKHGDCCVYCSYGSVACPPVQEARRSGDKASCCGA